GGDDVRLSGDELQVITGREVDGGHRFLRRAQTGELFGEGRVGGCGNGWRRRRWGGRLGRVGGGGGFGRVGGRGRFRVRSGGARFGRAGGGLVGVGRSQQREADHQRAGGSRGVSAADRFGFQTPGHGDPHRMEITNWRNGSYIL